jgi:hypothetical protein
VREATKGDERNRKLWRGGEDKVSGKWRHNNDGAKGRRRFNALKGEGKGGRGEG